MSAVLFKARLSQNVPTCQAKHVGPESLKLLHYTHRFGREETIVGLSCTLEIPNALPKYCSAFPRYFGLDQGPNCGAVKKNKAPVKNLTKTSEYYGDCTSRPWTGHSKASSETGAYEPCKEEFQNGWGRLEYSLV